MNRAAIVSVLARYQKALPACDKIVRCLEASLAVCEPKLQKDIRHALEELVPLVGECMADLPAVVGAVEDLRHRLDKRRPAGRIVGGNGGEADLAGRVERLLLELEMRAASLESLAPVMPSERRPVHTRVSGACRRIADRLRGWQD